MDGTAHVPLHPNMVPKFENHGNLNPNAQAQYRQYMAEAMAMVRHAGDDDTVVPLPETLVYPRSSVARRSKSPRLDIPESLDQISEVNDALESLKLSSFVLKRAQGSNVQAEALFWPAGKLLQMQKLLDILQNQWKLPRPNLIVNLDAGTAHPMSLSTKQLRSLPQFRELCMHAGLQVGLLFVLHGAPADHLQNARDLTSPHPRHPSHRSIAHSIESVNSHSCNQMEGAIGGASSFLPHSKHFVLGVKITK